MTINEINKYNRRLKSYAREYGTDSPAYNAITAQIQILIQKDASLADKHSANSLFTTTTLRTSHGRKLLDASGNPVEVLQIRPANASRLQNTSAGKIVNKVVSNVERIPSPKEFKEALKADNKEELNESVQNLYQAMTDMNSIKDAFYAMAKEQGGLSADDSLLVAQAMDEYVPYRIKQIEMMSRALEYMRSTGYTPRSTTIGSSAFTDAMF